MRKMLLALVLGWTGVSAAAAGLEPSRGETPRATDLLRAERLADEVRRRLELPAVRVEAGWRYGGEGWRRRDAPAPTVAQDGDVVINVQPPRAGRRGGAAPAR